MYRIAICGYAILGDLVSNLNVAIIMKALAGAVAVLDRYVLIFVGQMVRILAK
jgi:hypothetical protein